MQRNSHMTKSQLIDELYKRADLTKPQITLVVETVFDSIKNSLAQGERVDIRNFGNFILRERKARKAVLY